MNIADIKLPIAVIGVILAQAFGIIWYVAQLDSTVKDLDSSVATMQESQANIDLAVLQTEVNNLTEKVANLFDQEEVDLSEVENSITGLETSLRLIKDLVDEERGLRHTTLDTILDSLDELEIVQAVINNEMRTIMTDHGGFAEVLAELQKSGVLPTGEKRQYGNYGN